MKRTSSLPTVAVAAIGILCTRIAEACPNCNIYNYLAGSVQSASNIFHGKVVRQIDVRTAEVEVLKVLRGKYKVGSKVKSEIHGSMDYIGENFIVSDPTSWPPTFEILPLEFEDEILFLIQKEPDVQSTEDAIKRVQGVSVLTQGIGMEFLTNHYDEAAGPLISDLERLMPDVFSSDDVFFGEHRLGKLLEALMSRESASAEKFALSYISKIDKADRQTIDWNSIDHHASSRGVFLRDMLTHSQKHKGLSESLRQQLVAKLPGLLGKTSADVVYALVLSTSGTTDDLHKVVMADHTSVDMLALGLYFAGNYKSGWWAHEIAYAFWDKALAIANQDQLRVAISERIKRSEKFHKRRERNADKSVDAD